MEVKLDYRIFSSSPWNDFRKRENETLEDSDKSSVSLKGHCDLVILFWRWPARSHPKKDLLLVFMRSACSLMHNSETCQVKIHHFFKSNSPDYSEKRNTKITNVKCHPWSGPLIKFQNIGSFCPSGYRTRLPATIYHVTPNTSQVCFIIKDENFWNFFEIFLKMF